MEPLLFILFVLFSLVSAILERRKRRKELERQEETRVRRPRLDQDDAEREAEEEDWAGKVLDPFELAEPEKKTGPFSAEAEEIERLEQELERREEEEKQMRLARASAERAERRAAQIEAQIEQIQERRHIEELVSERLEQESTTVLPRRRRRGRGRFSPAEARKAIVYAEIFGKPRAEREEGF